MAPENPAAFVKNFIFFHRHGVLSTHSLHVPGYPHGSVVPYDLDCSGNLIIYISKISQHFKNLSGNPKAGIFIPDHRGVESPQQYGRVSVFLDFEPVAEDFLKEVGEGYQSRFPDSRAFQLAHDFVFFAGKPRSIRWIAGFGSMGWVEHSDYASADPDPLSQGALSAIEHMNQDHRDALLDFVRAFGEASEIEMLPDSDAQMTWLSSAGFEITLQHLKTRKKIRVDFPEPVVDSADLRSAIVQLLQTARSQIQS